MTKDFGRKILVPVGSPDPTGKEREILVFLLILLFPFLLFCSSGFKLKQTKLFHPPGWESFRGNVENTGYVPQPIDTPNQLRWRLETKKFLKSSPVIAKEILFIGSLDKRLLFVDALSGEDLGGRKISTSISSSACVGDSILYFAYEKGGETFFALNLLTGNLLWKKKLGDISSSPQIYQDKIFIGSNSGLLSAFNRFTGEKIWEFKTEDAVVSTPACDAKLLFFGSVDDHLYALDKENGELKWKFKADGSIYSSPAIKAENPALRRFGKLTVPGKVEGQAQGGEQLVLSEVEGSRTTNGMNRMVPTNGGGDKVFFGCVDGHLYAVKIEDGSLLWKFKTEGDIYSSPAVTDSLVYIGSNDYSMYAVDQATGELRWKFETGSIIRSSPIAVGDKLFFGSYDGNFYVLDRFSGKLLWNYQTRGMISSSPAYYDGKIYIASEDGTLYCFGF
jgi:outer membrane protein assembly factor BamB